MAITAARRELLIAGLECHEIKRDQLAAELRATRPAFARANLMAQHAEACRCVAAFQAELAKG